MVTLKRDHASGTPRAASAARLLTLAGNPNWQIAQFALTALLDAAALPPELVWNAAVLASELFIAHRAVDQHGIRNESLQEAHRAAALGRALARFNHQHTELTLLANPPDAWVRESPAKRRRPEDQWAHPDPDFEPYYAKDLIRHFSIE